MTDEDELNHGPPFKTPNGGTISSLAPHHRIKSDRTEGTEFVSGDDGYLTPVETPGGAYVLMASASSRW